MLPTSVSVSVSLCFSVLLQHCLLLNTVRGKQSLRFTDMCTPWTLTRLVRWRVRDWASCFLPLDAEPASSPSPRVAFDKKNDNRIYDNKLSRPLKKMNKKRQTDNRMEKDKDEASLGNRVDDSSWSLSADEDYIVFCFREDGAFDVMKDCKSVKAEPQCGLDLNLRNSRPVNRKLHYSECAEQTEERFRANHEQEKEIVNMRRQQHRNNNIRKGCQIEEVEDKGMVSSESGDSNQSEGSTGSFAFPVLGWEWTGSPVQLPKTEGLHPSKQKVRSLRFQCCRF